MITRTGLLELLFRAELGLVPLRCVVRTWSDRSMVEVARELSRALGTSQPNASRSPQPLSTGVKDVEHRCWVASRNCFRVDTSNSRMVVVGNEIYRWHAKSGSRGAVSFRSYSPRPKVAGELEGRSLLAEAMPIAVGEARHLGRRVHVVRADREELSSRPTMWSRAGERAPEGSDRRELLVDAEHGLILRDEAFLGDVPIWRHEVTEIELHTLFADDTFAFVSPEGDVAELSDAPYLEQRLFYELDQTIDECGFRPLLPRTPLADRSPEIWLARYRNGATAVCVTTSCPTAGTSISIFQSREPLPELVDAARDVLLAGGLWQDEGSVSVLMDGIWVRAVKGPEANANLAAASTSSIAGTDFVALVRDLVPCPTDLPPLVEVDRHGRPGCARV